MSGYVDIVMARSLNGTGILNRRQLQIVSVISMLIFLSTLAVALRFISRRMMTGHFYLDDYVIVFALVREKSFAQSCGNLISPPSSCHTETAFVNLSVSGGSLLWSTKTADHRFTKAFITASGSMPARLENGTKSSILL